MFTDVVPSLIEAFYRELKQVREVPHLFACVVQVGRSLGFDWCSYALHGPLPLARPRGTRLTNHPPRWHQRYEDARYHEVDPILKHGLKRAEPLVWSEKLFGDAVQMREEACSFGLVFGWSQSCFDGQGRVGVLSLARPLTPVTIAELQEKEPTMRWLANIAHLMLSDGLTANRRALLTCREEQVLRWTADGKTSPEIAQILALSVHTVNFHIKQAMAKLGAATKAAAAASLVAQGGRYPAGS